MDNERLERIKKTVTKEKTIGLSDIYWLIKQAEQVEELEKELDKELDVGLRMESDLIEYEKVLKDFAEYGTKHDTLPTLTSNSNDVMWWYNYIQSMDNYVREKAKRVLRSNQ